MLVYSCQFLLLSVRILQPPAASVKYHKLLSLDRLSVAVFQPIWVSKYLASVTCYRISQPIQTSSYVCLWAGLDKSDSTEMTLADICLYIVHLLPNVVSEASYHDYYQFSCPYSNEARSHSAKYNKTPDDLVHTRSRA